MFEEIHVRDELEDQKEGNAGGERRMRGQLNAIRVP
jgi:hypothetical protein